MNILSMPEKPFQKLYPLSLFVQAVSQQFTGCLYVINKTTNWSIFLEGGKLLFATNSDRPMARLERHLQELTRQTPALADIIQRQGHYQHTANAAESSHYSDFYAIRWLFENSYLDRSQVTTLIEELAKEVIELFLEINEGSYEFIQQSGIGGYQGLCQIELRPLVEACQMQWRRKQASLKPTDTTHTANSDVRSKS
jgi:twitching motility two-component system response regulator PilG